MQNKLTHPCKDTCSGYKQGYEETLKAKFPSEDEFAIEFKRQDKSEHCSVDAQWAYDYLKQKLFEGEKK